MRCILVFASLFLSLSLPAGAAVADGETYVQAFKRHVAAREAGDMEEAVEAAERAYTLAQAKGDVRPQTLATLAYNWIDVAIWDDPKSVRAPGRYLETYTEENGVLPGASAEQVAVMTSYVNAHRRAGQRNATALFEALDALRAAEPITAFMIEAHLESAILLQSKDHSQRAYEIANRMSQRISELPEVPIDIQASLNLIRANAMIAQKDGIIGTSRFSRERRKTLRDAHVLVDQTIALYPQQTGINTYNKFLATAMAWGAVLSSLEMKAGMEKDPEHEFEGKRRPELPSRAVTSWPDAQTCVIQWAKQTQIEFPDKALLSGASGGVIVGYHFTKEGRVEGAQVLAEVPYELYGDYALAAMEDWRADMATVKDPVCLRDRTVWIQFSTER